MREGWKKISKPRSMRTAVMSSHQTISKVEGSRPIDTKARPEDAKRDTATLPVPYRYRRSATSLSVPARESAVKSCVAANSVVTSHLGSMILADRPSQTKACISECELADAF